MYGAPAHHKDSHFYNERESGFGLSLNSAEHSMPGLQNTF